jgi:hypothetical protein
MREDCIVLEHHANIALVRGRVVDPAAIERDRPRILRQEAIVRSKVVLPQPLGPSRVKNSPSRIARSMRSRTRSAPYDFDKPAIVTSPTPASLAIVRPREH